jgi:SPP1 family predicted phage head-tail adaptor
MMDINKLDKRVIIEQNMGNVSDGAGNKIPNWQPIAEVWAGVKPLNGSQTNIAEKKAAQITHNVKMRYRTDIVKDKHRINFKGRILAIEYIINKDERNVELNLQCVEG